MEYNTKQREILVKFFNDNKDTLFSVDEMTEKLQKYDISISAVYRNLSELEKLGKVRKTSKAGSRKAYYQYVDCDDCHGHLHMSCTVCGKTTHLDDGKASILSKVLEDANFNIDKTNTVLYGTCENCKHKE